MSRKRTSSESSNDEQKNEAPDSIFHQQPSAKRAKLASFSDTTLHDLPMELFECILVKAIAMEVKGMKLAKSVWKEKADLVISRLQTVCSQWNIILTTNFFRNAVHRILDGTALRTIRVEILHQSPIPSGVDKVFAMKDEMFMRYDQDGKGQLIKVYNRNNLVDVKDVIRLPEEIHVSPLGLATCNVSNSLYAIDMRWQRENEEWKCLSVWRITKVAEHTFNISPWMSDLNLPLSSISVSANGSVIILSIPHQKSDPPVLSVYDANASLQHKIMLSPDISWFQGDDRVIQKSNGNIVVASHNMQYKTELTEVDMTGRIIRQYQSSVVGHGFTSLIFADTYGRILISDLDNRMELLDSEFNLLDFTGPQFDITYDTHYNIERNEIVGVAHFGGITIFRFTEE